jgi:hypothetical protein
MVIRKDLKTFCGLLQRLVPMELHTSGPPVQTFRSVEEIEADMRARGLTPECLIEMATGMREREHGSRLNGNGALNQRPEPRGASRQ